MNLPLRLAVWGLIGVALLGAISFAPNNALVPGPRLALAANVDITLNADPDDNIVLGLTGPGCPSTMAPGDTCAAAVSISNNASDLAIDYTATAVVSAGAECDAANPGSDFTVTLGNFLDTTDNPGGDDIGHMPARTLDTESFDVRVNLAPGAGNSCQTATATVLLTVDSWEDIVDRNNRTDVHIGSKACLGPFTNTITGTSASETLRGFPNGRNRIVGNGGNDTIIGAPKDDCIEAGPGNDVVDGGQGDDEIYAGEGRNDVRGGPGNDSIFSGAGDDTIDAGEGNDLVNAGNGSNKVTGGPHFDDITTGSGNDFIDGTSGTDVCRPGGGSDVVANCEGS